MYDYVPKSVTARVAQPDSNAEWAWQGIAQPGLERRRRAG